MKVNDWLAWCHLDYHLPSDACVRAEWSERIMALALFVHGFGGHRTKTWGRFPELLNQDAELSDWKSGFYSYPTRLVHVLPFWPPPRIQLLASGLRTEISHRHRGHDRIVLVCHSLGGLIARQMIADLNRESIPLPVVHLLLYATPNDGAALARLSRLLSWHHHQARQLCRNSDFLDALNKDWRESEFLQSFPVTVVVGAKDAVVSEESAKGTWPGRQVETVVGAGHLDLVKPKDSTHISYLVAKNLLKTYAPNPPLSTDLTHLSPRPASQSVDQHDGSDPLPATQTTACGDPAARRTGLRALHQLPAPPDPFVGRVRDLQDLIDTMSQGARATNLWGMGGIGKSALALTAAHRVSIQYPDAQIYLNLRGSSESPLRAEEVMAYVIRSFEPMVRLPDDPSELIATYRSVLHGKRALLLFDDARDQAQISPLLTPAGSSLLVTSRWRFSVPGSRPYDLPPLSVSDSVELLLAVEPRIGQCAEELAALCGHLPLALRAAGSLLTVKPDLSPTAYLEELAAERDRLQRIGDEGVGVGIEACLDLSYQRPPQPNQRTFRLTSVFPGSFDSTAEESVCEDPGHRGLSELVRYSLVTYEPASGRYRLHDLARLFAKLRLEETERHEVSQRHAKYFLGVLRNADELFVRGGEDLRRGLELFDRERGNFEAGQSWAAMNAEHDQRAAHMCSDYPDFGAECLHLRQHPQTEHIPWLEAAVTAARKIGDRRGEAGHLGNLGVAYLDLGKVAESVRFFEEALGIFRTTPDKRGEALALGNLGVAFAEVGEYCEALDLHKQALAILQELGDERGKSAALCNVGACLNKLDKPLDAIGSVDEARAIARDADATAEEAEALCTLGEICLTLQDWAKAAEHCESAMMLSRALDDRPLEARSLSAIGLALLHSGKPGDGLDSLDCALEMARAAGNRLLEGDIAFHRSLALLHLSLPAEATESARRALAIFEGVKGPRAANVRAKLLECCRNA